MVSCDRADFLSVIATRSAGDWINLEHFSFFVKDYRTFVFVPIAVDLYLSFEGWLAFEPLFVWETRRLHLILPLIASCCQLLTVLSCQRDFAGGCTEQAHGGGAVRPLGSSERRHGGSEGDQGTFAAGCFPYEYIRPKGTHP